MEADEIEGEVGYTGTERVVGIKLKEEVEIRVPELEELSYTGTEVLVVKYLLVELEVVEVGTPGKG